MTTRESIKAKAKHPAYFPTLVAERMVSKRNWTVIPILERTALIIQPYRRHYRIAAVMGMCYLRPTGSVIDFSPGLVKRKPGSGKTDAAEH